MRSQHLRETQSSRAPFWGALGFLFLAIIAIGLAVWVALDPGGEKAGKGQDHKATSLDPGAVELAASVDGIPSGRLPIEDGPEDEAGDGHHWYDHPEKIGQVMAFWEESLQEATNEVSEWRGNPEMLQGEGPLKESIARFSGDLENGRVFNQIERDDFLGLMYDTAGEAHRLLEYQMETWNDWYRQIEEGDGSLPPRLQRLMKENPIVFPAEFFCFQTLESLSIPDDPVFVDQVNRVRNEAIAEYASLGGNIFIMENAMSRCMEKAGMKGLPFPGAPVFREHIPLYRDIEEGRSAVESAYAQEIRWIILGGGYEEDSR